MKNKLILLACTVIVMMLCACQPLNVSSADSDVVTVAFKVSGEGVQAKAITIGNPLFDGDIIYQYKAIPGFTSKGKEIVGATGDVWTDFPTVYNGSTIKMKFSKGPWTFDVRGIDRRDLTPLYKISIPLKVSIYSNSAQDIVFEMEEDPEGFSTITNKGVGTVNVDIIAQGNSEKGELVLDFNSISDDSNHNYRFGYSSIDGFKSFFVKNIDLASGNYELWLTYHDGNYKTPMGPYLVKVLANKNTSVAGVIAHLSEFETTFSARTDNGFRELNCTALFETTAFAKDAEFTLMGTYFERRWGTHPLDPTYVPKDESEAEAEAVAVAESEAEAVAEENVKEEIAKIVDAKRSVAVFSEERRLNVVESANFAEIANLVNANKETAEKQVMPEPVRVTYNFICDGVLINDQIDGAYNKEKDGWDYIIPRKYFNENLTEHTLVIRATITIHNGTLVAESEPISIFFENISKQLEEVKESKEKKLEEYKKAVQEYACK